MKLSVRQHLDSDPSTRGRSARRALRRLRAKRPLPMRHVLLRPGLRVQMSAALALVSRERLTNYARRVPLRVALHGLLCAVVLLVLAGDMLLAWSRSAVVPRDDVVLYINQRSVGGAGEVSGDTIAPVVTYTTRTERPTITLTSAVAASHLNQIAPEVRAVSSETVTVFDRLHMLAAGETLGGVAAAYGIALEALVWANPSINGDVLVPGMDLRIPRISGRPYVIQAGDTLESIAERTGVAAELIVEFKANGISRSKPLPVGHELFIPGNVAPLPEPMLVAYGGLAGLAATGPQPAGIVREWQTNMRQGPDTVYEKVGQFDAGRRAQLLGRHQDWVQVSIGGTVGWMNNTLLDIPAGVFEQLPESADFPPPPPIWVWPARGSLTSGYGPRWGGFHDGIDIANAAWTPIVAARAGRVVEAGWCSGYGYCVRLNHDGGIQTVYGHLIDQPPVRVGQTVPVGTVIGYMGSTYDRRGGGYSTGVHLHFEVRVGGRTVNPFNFLP
ncbi:MAG: peptidoglycan DD-metalloendopeptidase family protein [Chloroflexaceae bacterium]|nr:peptidoglycan DD-metalloendopeptidase family protein [Chloroflexaceae bacterium]